MKFNYVLFYLIDWYICKHVKTHFFSPKDLKTYYLFTFYLFIYFYFMGNILIYIRKYHTLNKNYKDSSYISNK